MKYIHFIINPIAGSGKQKIDKDYLSRFFEEDTYTLTVKNSNYKKHATELTKNSIKEGATIIVACGGDGTINEVASCLVGSSVLLGIIPLGSGNGLASNLKISKKIEDAINNIKQQSVKKIDVGRMHEKYFFSNAGVGFDASVIKNYENSEHRKLSSYIKASLKSFKELNYQNEVEIIINDVVYITKPFMVFISNSNELGYNVSLTPKASLQDGLLDVLIISKINKLKVLLLGFLMLFKKHHKLKDVRSLQAKEIKLKRRTDTNFQTQIDGELYAIKEKAIMVSVLEKSLNVIAR